VLDTRVMGLCAEDVLFHREFEIKARHDVHVRIFAAAVRMPTSSSSGMESHAFESMSMNR
jgi:hypothetical protein